MMGACELLHKRPAPNETSEREDPRTKRTWITGLPFSKTDGSPRELRKGAT
jgi:hypothetical protein